MLKVGDTCFGFLRLLMRIFQASEVPLEGLYRTTVESMNTITPVVLRFITMDLER